MIIATAGHVDHGKTSLVKALTGVDTDTLAEERARGLTINLGYAFLPTEKGTPIGFIDVPGHHRFINNMIAGASSIKRALLVVAVDDGVMPQTLEHLDVLTLLGVKQIDIVVTKIDCASEKQVHAVSSEIRSLVRDQSDADPRVFHVSNTTGAGIDELRTYLLDRTNELNNQRANVTETRGFRLSIDRRFHVKGAGIVVTGTASAGRVRVGDVLQLIPHAIDMRVKEVRANDVRGETATAGQRVALCIAGKLALKDIERGDLLVDVNFAEMSERIDVSLRLLPQLANPLKHLSPVKVHIGAKRLAAQVALINNKTSSLPPGASSKAQLILQEPLCATHGERFVIRDDSETNTLGGGAVLDPIGPKFGKSKIERLHWLDALEHTEIEPLINTLVEQVHCIDLDKLTSCFNLKGVASSTLTPKGCIDFQASGKQWITRKSNLAETRKVLIDAVQQSEGKGNAQQNNVMSKNALRDNAEQALPKLGIGREKLLALVGRTTHPALAEATLPILLKKGELQSFEGKIRLPVALDAPNPHDALWQSLERVMEAASINIPVISEAKSQARLSDGNMKLAMKRGRELGRLQRVNSDRFILTKTLVQFAKVAEQIAETQSLSVIAYKKELNIGRKLAIEMLEYFDSIGLTRRSGDHREIINKAVIEKRFVT